MSNALKFTPPHGTVTIALKASQLENADKMESDQSLTKEEAVLLPKYRAEALPPFFAAGEGDVDLHSDSADFKKDVDVYRDVSAHEEDADTKKSEAHDESDHATVDGKEFKKFCICIASFVDTGAGISKVGQALMFGAALMLTHHCR